MYTITTYDQMQVIVIRIIIIVGFIFALSVLIHLLKKNNKPMVTFFGSLLTFFVTSGLLYGLAYFIFNQTFLNSKHFQPVEQYKVEYVQKTYNNKVFDIPVYYQLEKTPELFENTGLIKIDIEPRVRWKKVIQEDIPRKTREELVHHSLN